MDLMDWFQVGPALVTSWLFYIILMIKFRIMLFHTSLHHCVYIMIFLDMCAEKYLNNHTIFAQTINIHDIEAFLKFNVK